MNGSDREIPPLRSPSTFLRPRDKSGVSNSRADRASPKKAVVGRLFSALSQRGAKILVCTLTVLIASVDFSVPANINLATLYFVCIVLLIWARSVKWLWICTVIFILLTFGGIIFGPPAADALTRIDWFNRCMTALTLVIAAVPVHLRLHSLKTVELAIVERD